MFPATTISDVLDRLTADAVSGGDETRFLTTRCSDAYFENLGDRQPRLRKLLPALENAVPAVIGLVGDVRVPAQVIEPVVLGVPVPVAALHTLGAWADESFEHEGVDAHDSLAAVTAKVDERVAALDISGGAKRASNKPTRPAIRVGYQSAHAAHVAQVGDFVKTIEADNGLPVFDDSCRVARSHKRLLCAVGQGLSGAKNTRKARAVYTCQRGAQ